MALSQKVMFSTMILASLAVTFSRGAAVPQLSAVSSYNTYAGAMQRLFQRDSGAQVSVEAVLTTCNPPCATNQCCLQTSATTQAFCSPTRLSGASCVNPGVYSGSNPDPSNAVQQSMCPCALGMMCMPTGASTGVCSGFKK